MIKHSPQLSSHQISNRAGIFRTTVWRTLKKENCHLQTVQNLHPGESDLRLNFCQWVQENQNAFAFYSLMNLILQELKYKSWRIVTGGQLKTLMQLKSYTFKPDFH